MSSVKQNYSDLFHFFFLFLLIFPFFFYKHESAVKICFVKLNKQHFYSDQLLSKHQKRMTNNKRAINDVVDDENQYQTITTDKSGSFSNFQFLQQYFCTRYFRNKFYLIFYFFFLHCKCSNKTLTFEKPTIPIPLV